MDMSSNKQNYTTISKIHSNILLISSSISQETILSNHIQSVMLHLRVDMEHKRETSMQLHHPQSGPSH